MLYVLYSDHPLFPDQTFPFSCCNARPLVLINIWISELSGYSSIRKLYPSLTNKENINQTEAGLGASSKRERWQRGGGGGGGRGGGGGGGGAFQQAL